MATQHPHSDPASLHFIGLAVDPAALQAVALRSKASSESAPANPQLSPADDWSDRLREHPERWDGMS